jgi:hypothetical protein
VGSSVDGLLQSGWTRSVGSTADRNLSTCIITRCVRVAVAGLFQFSRWDRRRCANEFFVTVPNLGAGAYARRNLC